MATLTIRQIDDGIKNKLRQRAAERGVSMEEEARQALANWVHRDNDATGMGTRIRRRFAPLGGVELDIPSRAGAGRPLPFADDE